jgi:substrate import-associated zinc metallohydrolase lipoprotein
VKHNVPRVIHLIGSPAYNSNGTMVLGTAEGGLKVTLYMVNNLTDAMLSSYASMTQYYFHTMHHEFTHILNQKKPYDTSYNKITESGYVSGNWYQIADSEAHGKGFVTPYAMSEGLEDFAEMLSTYITYTPEQWQAILDDAQENGGDEAVSALNQKLKIVKNYMKDSWNVDIDVLRAAILRRGSELSSLDLEHLK